MKVSNVDNQRVIPKHPKLNAAKRGAIITSGILSANAAISWITKPDLMKQEAANLGGVKNYIKTFMLGTAILAAIGAGLNVVINTVVEKVIFKNKKPPKAAN